MGLERDHPVRRSAARDRSTPCRLGAARSESSRASSGRGRPVTDFLTSCQTGVISCFTPSARPRAAACTSALSVRPTRTVSSMRTRRRSSPAPDRVLFAREGALWAQRLELTASATGRRAGAGLGTGRGQWTSCLATWRSSETAPGLIAYRAGAGTRQFSWFDRTGRQIGALGASRRGAARRASVVARRPDADVSPDARRQHRHLVDRDRPPGPAPAHIRSRPGTTKPSWSPGGDRIVFTSDRNGVLDLYETAAFRWQRIGATPLLETSEHKNMQRLVRRRAVHALLGPEPHDGQRRLGPAAVWGPNAHRRCTHARQRGVARASRPMADGWPTNPTKAAGTRSTCSRFRTPLGGRRFRQPAARRRSGGATEPSCSSIAGRSS